MFQPNDDQIQKQINIRKTEKVAKSDDLLLCVILFQHLP